MLPASWTTAGAHVLSRMPVLQIEELGGTLLEVEVGDKSVWKETGHPLRSAAELQLTAENGSRLTAVILLRDLDPI